MKLLSWLGCGILLTLLAGCDPSTPGPQPPTDAKKGDAAPPSAGAFEVGGRSQAVPARKAIISPVPTHPVVEVLVAPGDRVKMGQTLIKLDDDEPRADVRAKEAELETARLELKEARRYLGVVEDLYKQGACPEHCIHETRVAALKAEAAEHRAQAALEGAKAELEHYTMEAPIDGVVSWLDVNVGLTLRPRTKDWGEILDLSEIDVRCELTPEQVDQVRVGQAAEVRAKGQKDPCGVGRVACVGIAADPTSGLVPVVVRLDNAKAKLRCAVPVTVRFVGGSS
jgi:membrane fusion protein, multidrug efflux system